MGGKHQISSVSELGGSWLTAGAGKELKHRSFFLSDMLTLVPVGYGYKYKMREYYHNDHESK